MHQWLTRLAVAGALIVLTQTAALAQYPGILVHGVGGGLIERNRVGGPQQSVGILIQNGACGITIKDNTVDAGFRGPCHPR